MTEIKKIEGFTPGPWYIETAEPNEHSIMLEVATNDVLICGVYFDNNPMEEPEVKATASLIAYAPDLYKIALEQQEEIERLKGHIEKIKELKASAMDTKGLFPLLQYISNNL